eukprot:TRINITY_DN1961_c0_g1_i1.p1 TRINITY_DN1961_c0_g1~~TRINITY_DN1961_c0_g1_i1.p1  ORF type:complete len:1136 (+),score=287.99 TRINITY_DN1961_c0_g1_i1:86-3493(+)
MSSVMELEKMIRNLRKKVTGIEDLEKKNKGKLNDEQKDKVKRKPGLLKEITDLKAKVEALKAGDKPAETNGNGHAKEEEVAPEPEAAPKEDPQEAVSAIDKEIKKTEKKLKSITELKEKKAAGTELNPEQAKKLKTLQKVQQELHNLKMEKEKTLKKAAAPTPTPAPTPSKKEVEEHPEEEEEEDDPLKVDTTTLMKMYKEFDAVNDLARRIAMGKLKKPTQIQKNRAAQVTVLQAAITKEEERIASEEKRLRREAGLPEEEPEPELTEQEQRLNELNKLKAAAVENEDFEEAARLKKLIAKVEAGEPEEEPEAPPAPTEPDADEAEWNEFEKPVVETEQPEEEIEAKIEEPVQEEEAAPEPEPEPEKAESEPEPVPEPEVEPEPEPEKPPTPKEKPVPKTAEELGISFVTNKGNKGKKASTAVATFDEDEEDEEDDGQPKLSFDEMMREAKAKKTNAATAPYTVTFSTPPTPCKSEARHTKKEGILAKQAAKRLLKDLRDLAECPLYTVKADPANDDLFTWHTNVAPREGPYAGTVVHFVVYFPNTYPLEAPVVRCCSAISHDCIIDTTRHTSEVCLHINDRNTDPKKGNEYKGWSPSYTARTVLSHLATMFDESYVAPNGKAPKRLEANKLMIQNYVCKETGHSLENPYPPLPCFNGPFDKYMPASLKIDAGALWCTTGSKAAHYWMHNYSTEGRHYFRCVLRTRNESEGAWRVGYSTPDGNVLELGSDEFGWCFEPQTGKLIHNNEETETGVTAGPGDVVDCVLDLNDKKVLFSVNGSDLPNSMELPDAGHVYHPTFMFSHDSGAEMIFVPNSTALPATSLPIAAVSSVIEDSPTCCVTKESSEECILGVGLVVERRANTVEAITPEPELISQETFVKGNVRKSISESKAMTSFLPLLLGAHHSVKTAPILENSIAEVLRNPDAKLPTKYRPPFKAASVVTVVSLALQGVVNALVGNFKAGQGPREHAVAQAISLWSHITHCNLSLCVSRPVLPEYGEKLVDEMLADQSLLTVTGLTVSPNASATLSILKGLLRQAVLDCPSVDLAYKGKVRTRVNFLLLVAALHEMFQKTTVEELTSSAGKPSAENVESFGKLCAALGAAKSLQAATTAAGFALSDDEIQGLLMPVENAES